MGTVDIDCYMWGVSCWSRIYVIIIIACLYIWCSYLSYIRSCSCHLGLQFKSLPGRNYHQRFRRWYATKYDPVRSAGCVTVHSGAGGVVLAPSEWSRTDSFFCRKPCQAYVTLLTFCYRVPHPLSHIIVLPIVESYHGIAKFDWFARVRF